MPEDVRRIFELQNARAPEIARATVRDRRLKIRRLHDAILKNRDAVHQALAEDLGKSVVEADLSELYAALAEARHAIRHLRRWVTRRVPTPLTLTGTRTEVRYEPKGVVLIIAPWNFPFNLTMGPLVSAIAAGNCAMVKPSELAPATSACVREIVHALFDESEIAVVEGDASIGEALLRLPFDHIFFTGSQRVGKLVMKAAAENLTPVTLELGGKSPAIVDETASLHEAARKIAWGKFLNNGQTCIAPDYVLVHSSVEREFTAKLLEQVREIWGDPDELPVNRDYGRIVGSAHHRRIASQLESAVGGGARILYGGTHDQSGRFFAPTVIKDAPRDCAILREEIFGPVLPLDTFETVDEAIARVNAIDHPLVLYVFSRSRAVSRRIIAETRAGATLINDTLLHFFQLYMPFGGIGGSGQGKAHGEAGFRAFSNARGVMRPMSRWSMIQLLYPPYNSIKRKLAELTIRYL